MSTPRTTRTTRDLGLAAYMHAHGLVIDEVYGRQSRRGVWDYRFTFLDPAGRWGRLTLNYANSPESRFNDAQRTLKRLAKEAARRDTC